MGLDPAIGGEDALDNDSNLRAPYTRPPHDGTYAVAQDGFVFVSPSVYVVFPIILATNDCGLVGNAYTSWTLGVPEHQLSTYQRGFGTSAFNPADLGCPGPDPGKLGDEYELDDEANQGAPSVLLPADLTALDPAWKSCVLGGLDLGRDPPRALRPASDMVPKAASHVPAPVVTQSLAFPRSTPKSPARTRHILAIQRKPDLRRFQKTLQISRSKIFKSRQASVRPSLVHRRDHQRQRNRLQAKWQPLESGLEMTRLISLLPKLLLYPVPLKHTSLLLVYRSCRAYIGICGGITDSGFSRKPSSSSSKQPIPCPSETPLRKAITYIRGDAISRFRKPLDTSADL